MYYTPEAPRKEDFCMTRFIFALQNIAVLDSNCGGVITKPQTTIQNRDRDGDGMYDIIDYCVWNIVAPVDTLIKIDTEMLELEFEIECRSDFLEVRNFIPSQRCICVKLKTVLRSAIYNCQDMLL